MNRKLRVIILTMVLTVLMFGGTRLMAEDNLDVNTTEASQTETPKDEGNLGPKANGDEEAPLVDTTEENTESDTIDTKDSEKTDMGGVPSTNNEGETPDTNQKDKAGDENADKAKDAAKGDANGEKADTPKESGETKAEEGKDADAQKSLEENKESAKGNGAEDGAAPAKAPETPAEGEPKTGEEGTEPKKPTPEVNPDEDKDLSELKAQIDKEQDPAKKAKLQKQYNEKYLEKVEADGKEKLDKEVVNSFTDSKRNGQYKEIQELYDKIQSDRRDGKLNQEDIDKLNKLLGEFKPPRKLTDEEKKAREDLDKDFEIPRVEKDTKDKVFEKYKNAKDALEKALDPNEDPVTPKKLKELQDAYKEAKAALDQAITDEKINPKYTEDGKPEVRVYPLDGSTAGKELQNKDDTYYIPDNTSTNLLIEVRKDDGGDFTFTIKPNKTDKNIPDAVIKELKDAVKFKDGSPVELTYDAKTGTYSFTTSNKFEIAQIQMNLPAFRAAFHEGFEITMQAGNEKEVTKKFLITKKGYDDADIGTIGKEDQKHPQEIDGGDTKDGIVDEDTKKVYDIFAMIKETDGYIDDVIVNSSNGESLPLSSVDITITLPKYSDKFAKYLYKSGLEYQEIEEGKYQLRLQMKNFGGNLKEKDGKLYLDNKEITPAELKDKILEEAGKKVYFDENGDKHDVTTEEYYEVTDGEGNTFKVQAGKLYKKDGETYTEIGEFKNGKLKDGDITYVFNNGKLISYTDEKDLFEGNVSNKDGKADLDVTPTYDGDQVIVNTTVEGKNKEAYGGTIIKDGIFDKDNKYTGKTSSEGGYQGYETAYVDINGKILKDKAGNVVTSLTKEQEGKYTKAENAVFNSNGFIVSGLTYKKDYRLIDKFGKIIDGVTVTKGNDGKYSFQKGTETQNQNDNTIKVENGKKFVGNDNYIVDPNGYEDIVGKYYYDKGKFEKVEDTDKGIKGNKYYKDYKSSEMTFNKVDSYTKNGKKEILKNKETYHGSTNPDDYVTVDGKTYVKKQAGSLVYYVGVDADNQAEVLSVEQISKIVQIFNDGTEKITDETDIAEAVKNAKFQIKFPGFLAGRKVVYNIHADIAATYMAPNPGFDPKQKESDTNKKFVETSIFKNKEGKPVEVKKIDKYFTLKVKEGEPASFFKNPPKELLAKPDYNFFNIFYREKDDQKTRDEYIKYLLELDRKDDKNKKDILILDKIQSELGRLYDGAKFAIRDNKLVILDKNDDVITLDRSLLWEVGFNNPDGALFPENKDSEIIIEDHNMDNRLIYDEIIVNDTQKNWDAAKKDFENDPNNKGKKFGNEEYFFIDQIKDIRFGVSPNYIDGRFVPLGADFKITSDEILAALKNNQDSANIINEKNEVIGQYIFRNGKHFIKKGGIEFEVRRDEAKGQIRIKVMNAFYAKPAEGSKNKFYSPVQEVYQEKINNLLESVKGLDATSTDDDINGIVEKLHTKGTDCYDTITEMLQKEFGKIKGNAEKLKTFRTKLIAEVEKLQLAYLDSKKNDGNYKYDDMRFNAIRIGLKSGHRIGGPIDPVQTKKLGITSVIIPEVDIPYTDEFGDALTNKDKYVQEAIGEIIKDHKFNNTEDKTFKFFDESGKPIWNKSEDSFRKVMEEAYRRVNEKIDSSNPDKKIEIKTLVTVDKDAKYGKGKYTVLAGNSEKLSFEDLANGDKALTDSKGQPLNPYYPVDKEGKAIKKDDGSNTTIADKITDDIKGTDAYKEFISRPIDIAGYYMSKLGYNGAMYANFANYKLVGGKDQAPGIFGKEDDWHKKICYPGLGSCIETAGGDKTSDKTDGGSKYGSEGEAGSEFELTYTPTPKTPDEEHPKVDKKSETDKVDVTKEPDKTVDFTIDVTVDKLKKDQKELSEALKPDSEKVVDANYDKETGYYIYRDGLIIDILPEIFEFTKDTKISIEVKKDAMKANGANAKLNFDDFKNGIKYFYTEDVKAYLAELKAKGEDKKYNVLLNALGGDENKIKDGQRAILAWLPEFEGPHGAKNQFKLTLSNLLVNKEKYKESEKYKNQGQPYTNKAGFGDEGEFFFGTKTITVTDGHNANVNKYLQLLDKDGDVIPQGEAGEWFKGSATLKFGDKFNYKIKYYLDNKGLVDTGFVQKDREWKLEDLFNRNKGLRPVLRDFVEVPEGFTVLYKVNGEYKSEITKDELAKVEGIKINPPEAGFPYNEEKEFILPMMIPELDAKIEDGNVVYVGKDGEKKILGKADEFFNLGNLTDKDKKLYFENKADKSNTVTVYLDKERFIKLYKEFFDANGNEIKKDRPEVKFDIYQIVIDENGKIIDRIKLDKELTLNEANDFVDQVNHLPLFKRIEEMDEKGNVTFKTLSYTYEVEEQAIEGYTGKVFTFDENDKLGFVLKAKNTEKPEEPEEPHDNPKKETKKVTVTIRVNKTWEVLNGGSTPSIEVELYANGKATGKIFTLGDGNWSATFKDLPAKDKDGNPIEYTVVEVGSVNNITMIDDRKFEVIYSTNDDGSITILNKEVPNDEEPKDKDEPHDDEEEKDRDQGKNRLPKTGVAEDLASIYFAFVLLLGLVFIKKRYLVK